VMLNTENRKAENKATFTALILIISILPQR